jgi:hypothetical protein
MAGGWFQWLFQRLSSQRADLDTAQKTLGGQPAVSLTVGAHDLSAYLWGYRYEEKAEAWGSLTIWLDNREDVFGDLTNDWPDLVRGAAIDLERGLTISGQATTAELPRCWIEGWRFAYADGTALLRLDCIDWRERCNRYRYATETTWDDTEVSEIVSDMLGEVGLTLASGSFSFVTDLVVSARRNLDAALLDAMVRVDEYLYAGLQGEILHKELDPTEVASYTYDWTPGSGKHPAMAGSEVAQTSPRYNKVAVIGGPDKEYSGSAQDAAEIALVGTRLRTVTDRDLTSNGQCEERARAELRYWQSQTITGKIVARPNFTLRMYDVLAVEAPPWGGPAVTGRVRRIVEEYGRGVGAWQQTIEIGGLAARQVGSQEIDDGTIDTNNLVEGSITADEIEADAVTAGKIATGSVTADKIAADAVTAAKIAADAIEAEHISTGAVEADAIAADAVTAAKINVSSLSAIAADMGELTAGTIKMGTGTKDSNLTGFQLDENELVGQNSGVDQVVLSSSDGKITAGAGAVVLDVNGMHAVSGTSDVNKHKIKDGNDTIMAMYSEIDGGVGASGTLESRGKNASNPEGALELVAITYDGAAASGVAALSIIMETFNGVMAFDASALRFNQAYIDMTEQTAPSAPGVNRARLFVQDNGSGKTQLCVRFNTGAVQVLATEP